MRNSCFSDAKVEAEIERLRQSSYVALARQEEEYRLRRRLLLCDLREQERRGRKLAMAGITSEMLCGYREEDT